VFSDTKVKGDELPCDGPHGICINVLVLVLMLLHDSACVQLLVAGW